MNRAKFTISLEARPTDARGKASGSRLREQAEEDVKEFNKILRKLVYGEPFTVIFQRHTDKEEVFGLTAVVTRSELGNDEQDIPTLKIQLESA